MNKSMNNQVTVHTMEYYTGKPLIQIRACINIRCSPVWKTVKIKMPIVWFYLRKFKKQAQLNDVSQITHWLKHEKYCLGMFWSPKSIVHLDLDGKYSCIYNYKLIKSNVVVHYPVTKC